MRQTLTALAIVGGLATAAAGQSFEQPYSSQLRTDPDVGTVQGIQRRGRALRTDQAEGDGYPYFVYPTVYANPFRTAIATGAPATATPPQSPNSATVSSAADEDAPTTDGQNAQRSSPTNTGTPHGANEPRGLRPIVAATSYFQPPVFEPRPMDTTAGLRIPSPVAASNGSVSGGASAYGRGDASAWGGFEPYGLGAAGFYSAYSAAFVNDPDDTKNIIQIYHQPLIQIKVRVVEVGRTDAFAAQSVLDYISSEGTASLFSGHNINENKQRTSGVTRFPAGNLIEVPATAMSISNLAAGTGGLINVTTEHLNFITSFLATELNADVITAPQVVTLNGQNVEFLSGQKQPFRLGQTVLQNDTKTVQQFFYKHVGTYISVTPRIVDWGLHGEGQGNAAIIDGEIMDWNGLIEFMVNEKLANTIQQGEWNSYIGGDTLVPYSVREAALKRLNEFTREDILRFLGEHPEYAPIFSDLAQNGCDCLGGCDGVGGAGCNWRPENCTLDLEVVVRLSDAGNATFTSERGSSNADDVNVSAESNVRAISNILQVKSGHGAVMAGLIGERDITEIVKIPVLGDIPVAGYLFRSKATNRQKTEILIFVEAAVINSDPHIARAQSGEDFRLSQPHIAGSLLDSPLEAGMFQAGFGSYLPPCTADEQVYWERHGRCARRVTTEVHDAFQ